MIVKEIHNKDQWENFLEQIQEKTFCQSWNWGEFQIAQGFKIWRLGVFENEILQAVALVIKIKAKRGTHLLIQHGPAVKSKKTEDKEVVLKLFIKELEVIGKKEKAVFIRMNPLWNDNLENREILKQIGLKNASMHANAYEATWKLDISKTEQDLLREMRKTTRYLIRQAEKNPEITIKISQDQKDLSAYQNLNREVALRQKFTPFSDNYIENEFKIFIRDNQALLFFGKYKGEIVAGALIIFWQGIGFYHQAGSLSKYAKLSIPYLLQWEAIKEAQKRGCKVYDFWGFIDPKKNPEHPWAGPTAFKMGYGGEAFQYICTQDYILSPLYWLTCLFEKIRKIKRKL